MIAPVSAKALLGVEVLIGKPAAIVRHQPKPKAIGSGSMTVSEYLVVAWIILQSAIRCSVNMVTVRTAVNKIDLLSVAIADCYCQ